ncbi:TolC family protein [Botrimarina hoheduenensis]|uniref:TolC family protein n=1 Tax=Botrimarina hoheduenensis TaxID=2528000 RepID=UPI001E5A89D1|nr:TolC family protein [Botrimarina hoheduenensis]
MDCRRSLLTAARAAALTSALIAAGGGGCRGNKPAAFRASACKSADVYAVQAASIDYPAQSCETAAVTAAYSDPPRLLSDESPARYRDLTLDEAIRLGLDHSSVLRDAGGVVLRAPNAATTVHDPGIVETGVEAALAAFDAQFTTSVFNEKNDRALNNEFFGGGTRLLQQDSSVWQTQLAKRSVTGSELALRQIVEFDSNNAPGNLFDSAWTTKIEGEVRQPLLQGAGLTFNRIAGPTRTPGVFEGVLVSRVNADIALVDFEIAVRRYVNDVENAYWDLWYAYRDLEARVAARDASLETWRRVKALYDAERTGGEADKEAQAREQYYRFQEEVENALSGKPIDGTQTGSGAAGGAFRGTPGVYLAERRLRRLVGLPASDGELLRPAREPIVAQVVFDWDLIVTEATQRRAELRGSRWRVRRRELELIASKNHLMPRLDAVGRYRFRGFGDDLLDSSGNNPRFDNSYEDLTSGDFQEWQLGVELDVPIGFRRAHSAIRNAELRLARERALLGDQQEGIVHEVAEAITELDRAYQVSQTAYNRWVAAQEQAAAVRAAYASDKAPLDLLLDAQRKLAEAASRRSRADVEHAIALKNVHFAKGTLLDFNGVMLAEGGLPKQAYRDAAALERRRGRPRPLNYASPRPERVSLGEYPQVRMGAATGVAVPRRSTPSSTEPSPSPAETLQQPAAIDPASFAAPGPTSALP